MKTNRALEVIPVHVLHRPHVAHAAVVAADAAPISVPSTSMQRGWNLNPFTSLLRRPVATPWSA